MIGFILQCIMFVFSCHYSKTSLVSYTLLSSSLTFPVTFSSYKSENIICSILQECISVRLLIARFIFFFPFLVHTCCSVKNETYLIEVLNLKLHGYLKSLLPAQRKFWILKQITPRRESQDLMKSIKDILIKKNTM